MLTGPVLLPHGKPCLFVKYSSREERPAMELMQRLLTVLTGPPLRWHTPGTEHQQRSALLAQAHPGGSNPKRGAGVPWTSGIYQAEPAEPAQQEAPAQVSWSTRYLQTQPTSASLVKVQPPVLAHQVC